jgi:hypothetical protein
MVLGGIKGHRTNALIDASDPSFSLPAIRQGFIIISGDKERRTPLETGRELYERSAE